MKKAPQRASQSGYVQSALRMSKEMRQRLRLDAEMNGRSMNAEILHRLESPSTERLEHDVAELKEMVRELTKLVRERL